TAATRRRSRCATRSRLGPRSVRRRRVSAGSADRRPSPPAPTWLLRDPVRQPRRCPAGSSRGGPYVRLEGVGHSARTPCFVGYTCLVPSDAAGKPSATASTAGGVSPKMRDKRLLRHSAKDGPFAPNHPIHSGA